MKTDLHFEPTQPEARQLAFSLLSPIPGPVELSRDGRGVYGIGISHFHRKARSDDYDLKRSCTLILRPDRFDDSRPGGAVLQKIVGGFRRGIFHYSLEENLRRFLHHEALRRAGLSWPPPFDDPPWWSADKKQQARNRGIYHGLRLMSLGIINNLIGKALEEAADGDAIKAARRFTFQYREAIYRAAARSRRALQLASTFPVAALLIYSDWRGRNLDKATAANLVERGALLRDVAAALGIPLVLRRIKPGAAHLAFGTLCQHPEWLHFMPDSLPRARIWLRVVHRAHDEVGPDYAQWVAGNMPQIPGHLQQVESFLSDIADWVKAGPRPSDKIPDPFDDIPDFVNPRSAFVTRPFSPLMSLNTVTALSAEWHEAVASNMDGPELAFPPPWYSAGTLEDCEILPIVNSAELYREGAAMRHCVGRYANEIKHGKIYVYSVRRDGKRLATLALGRVEGRASLIQIRGPCNAHPPKEIVSTVRRWLRAQTPLTPQMPPPLDDPW
jgi:PcfJ-like protein